jgi:hypothetical protein
MDLKFTPQRIASVMGVQFVMNGDTVTGFQVAYDVNYGKLNLPVQADIWPQLSDAQKAFVQALYNKLMEVGTAAVNAANQ